MDGAAITFVDNTRQKQTEAALRGAQAFAENMVSTVREPLLVLDEHVQDKGLGQSGRLQYVSGETRRDAGTDAA